ncbi:MarR family winged helix-turn-helix transcriptional regulator [Bhargavaea cecembensis]|uniref:MarR family winged helix-turn-helix transcriptional regulator n=1 Tax=Bhargavaea cecembensis TaxID=394098 RepID=UPI00058EF9DD|nr:MarR family transcriptional regulator [Bhargavaea cecembensis]
MELQPHQLFFRRFTALYRPLVLKVGEALMAEGLTVPQWSVLRLIAEEGEMSPAELAVRQNVEKPTISRNLHQLLERGLIDSRAGKDRREKIIFLTKDGVAVFEKAFAIVSEVEEKALRGIAPGEQKEMADLFAAIRNNLAE